MLCLPSIEIANQQISLPITDRCGVQLLHLMVPSRSSIRGAPGDLQMIESIVALCPATLFWSICRAQAFTSKPISFAELVDIVNQRMVTWLRESPAKAFTADGEICVGAKIKKRIRKFYQALAQSPINIESSTEVRRRFSKVLASISPLKSAPVFDWIGVQPLEPKFWKHLAQAFCRTDILANEVAEEWKIQRGWWHNQLSGTIIRFTDLCGLSDTSAEFRQRLHREKMESLKRLAYGASHEINNPLANIASRAQTLLSDEHDPERRRKLASINQQAFRAHEMIADMMLFAHPPEPELREVNPCVVVERVVREIELDAQDQESRLSLCLESVPFVQADETQLAVATKALIQNALEALKDSGEVTISVVEDASGQAAIIRVEDNGPGIEPGSLDHLFDPFYSGREAGRGLGFGLSKAWRIAELHGGDILAENRPDGGARFQFRIPYANAG